MKRTLILLLLFGCTLFLASAFGTLHANVPALLAGEDFNALRLLNAPVSYAAATLFCYALLIALLIALRYVRFPLWKRRACPPLRGTWRGLAALVLLALGVSFLMMPFNVEDPITMAMMEKMAHTPLGLFLLVIAGPAVEELVFREGMLKAMQESRYHAARAAFLSAALFAVIHGNLAQAIPAFAIGLLLAAFYIATGDLRLPLMGHILNNGLAVAAIFIPGLEEAEKSFSTPTSLIMGSIFTLAALVLALRWWRIQRKASIKWIMENE